MPINDEQSPDSVASDDNNLTGQQSGGGSTCVFTYDYDPETGELDIRFVERGAYRYYGVPWPIVYGLSEASSLGEYFNSEIRGQFSYDRIG